MFGPGRLRGGRRGWPGGRGGCRRRLGRIDAYCERWPPFDWAGRREGEMATADPRPGCSPVQTGYAPVNGLSMYYEIYGEGPPLVLLHGAYMSTGMWGGVLPG